MKKFLMVLCVLVMFFGLVGCPSSDDPATTSNFKSTTSTSVATSEASGSQDNNNPVPEPATLILLGSGLVGLVAFGRKKFKK
jgi:PEP-CTERM motif